MTIRKNGPTPSLLHESLAPTVSSAFVPSSIERYHGTVAEVTDAVVAADLRENPVGRYPTMLRDCSREALQLNSAGGVRYDFEAVAAAVAVAGGAG